MGNTLTAPSLTSTQQDLPTLLLDTPAYVQHSMLGGGKIFKTVQTLHEGGHVVLKVYVRRASDFDLKRYEAKLEELAAKLPLSQCPSVLNLVKIDITDRAVYLGRQYMGQNLVERFHVHPNLTLVEKSWFTYQMLNAVQQLHSRGIRHGDIKTENFLLTSWNWLFLVDIAFYKPTFLPNDNPADYHYYFENQGIVGSNGMITQSARRRCYLAPERFYSVITDRKFTEASVSGGSGGSDGQVSEAMDVFSLGCVIAELFLDGEQVLFDLPSLLAYREGEYDPAPIIAKIPQPQVRLLIRHMIQRDPAKRFNAKQYMKLWSTPGGLAALEANDANTSQTGNNNNPSSPLVSPLSPTFAALTASSSSASSPLFPSYFGYLYRFFAKLLTPELADPDIKVQALKANRDAIVKEVLGHEAAANIQGGMQVARLEQAPVPVGSLVAGASSAAASATAASTHSGVDLLEAVTRLREKLEKDTTGLAALEELQRQERVRMNDAATRHKPINVDGPTPQPQLTQPTQPVKPGSSPFLSPSVAPSAATLLDLASASIPSSTPVLSGAAPPAMRQLDPLSLESPAMHTTTHTTQTQTINHGNGLTMICSIVCACLQNVRYPITKLTALELLADFGAFVDDEVRLGRLVPYAVALLTDDSSMVRSTSCHIITKLFAQVQSIHSGSDAHLFLEYIMPSLSRFPNDPEEIVRLAYAQNIAELATSSKRFLDMAQHARQLAAVQSTVVDASVIDSRPPALSPFDATYAADLSTLQDTVLKLIIDMLTIGGSKVKRALLADITKLCVFMGRKRVNNELLPHLITVLNDRDWQLRSAFFEYIVGVSVFVGRVAFQNFVLPCIEQALFDVAEFVIERAVHALTALSQLGLFEKRTMLEVGAKVGPLLCHPSAWIRAETIKFIASMSAALGPAKSLVFLQPILKPFLKKDIPDMTVETLTQHLKPHLTRDEFRRAVAGKAGLEESNHAATNNHNRTNSNMVTPSKALPMVGSGQAMSSHPSVPFGGESYLGPSRLFDASNSVVASSWLDPSSSVPQRLGPAATPVQSKRPPLVAEESPDGLDDSIDSAAGSNSSSSSAFHNDPVLAKLMHGYLQRVSSAIQAKSLQSPSNSGSTGDARLTSMDEDSLLIEMQNLSLSQALEEQLPLHQIDIEPTVPELASLTAVDGQRQLDRAAQETFDSLGIGIGSQDRRSAQRPSIDPSLQPPNRATIGPTPSATGATTQPVALRESISLVPAYIKAALGVPLPPPNLGSLRSDWTTHSTFYGNHRVLTTSPDVLADADTHEPKLWRPKGILVATLAEHRHVRTLAISRDNLFMASGGDEGVVKIWDSQRLKLTAHARSQLSYVQQGRIMSLAVCDSSHSVASASSNGSLHVFKVEYAASMDDSGSTAANKYIGLSDVKRVDPDPINGEGAILKVAHFNTLTESLLMYGTQKAVHGWDLRSKKECMDLKLEPSMGLLTAMDIGPSPYVLVTGTSRGFITVWDMRFQLPVQVWRHSAKTAITQLTSVDAPSILPKEVIPSGGGASPQYPHPTKGPLFFASAEGTNQLAGFDICTGESRMLLRVLNPSSAVSSASGAAPARKGSFGPAQAPQLAPAAAGAASYPTRTRQKVRVSPLSLPSLRSYIRSDYSGSSASSVSLSTPSSGGLSSCVPPPYSASSGFYPSLMGVTLDDSFVREFATLGHPDQHATANGSTISSALVCKEAFVVTAGDDKKLRFWDLAEPANSYRAIVDLKAFEFPQKMLATGARDGTIKIWI